MHPKFLRTDRRVIRVVLAACFGAIALIAAPAHGIVLGTTDTSAFSNIASPYSGMNLKGVVSWNGSSAVAIGKRHLLTADHVGGSVGSHLTLNGVTYTATSVTTAPADPGTTKPVDLRIITVDRDLPTYHQIRTAPLTSGTSVVMAGYGVTGEDHGSYFTTTPGRGTLRWGTNTISYPAIRQTVGTHSSVTFALRFNSGATAYEAGFGAGDSGGGTFVRAADGSWQLAGINAYVSNHNGIADQYNQSYAITLAEHLDWIAAVTSVTPVPEPASVALLALLAAPLAVRRRSRTR